MHRKWYEQTGRVTSPGFAPFRWSEPSEGFTPVSLCHKTLPYHGGITLTCCEALIFAEPLMAPVLQALGVMTTFLQANLHIVAIGALG